MLTRHSDRPASARALPSETTIPVKKTQVNAESRRHDGRESQRRKERHVEGLFFLIGTGPDFPA